MYAVAHAIGIGVVDAAEIDRVNILQATLRSMAMAVANLRPQPDHLLIDGIFTITSDLSQQAIKKGDSLSISIAAASIVAKVTRDRIMAQVDTLFPEFGFCRIRVIPPKRTGLPLSDTDAAPSTAGRSRGFASMSKQLTAGRKKNPGVFRLEPL